MQSNKRNGVVRIGGRPVAFTADAIDNLAEGGMVARKTAEGIDLGCRRVTQTGSYQCGSQAYHPRRKKR